MPTCTESKTKDITENELLIYIKEWLRYDLNTGKLYWKKTANKGTRVEGREAGRAVCNGYKIIKLKNKSYRVHRIIFLLMTGRFPQIVDHINRDRIDNRWDNLRETDSSGNCYNRSLDSRNTTGVTGVYYYDKEGVFTITYGKEFLGRSKSFFDAVCFRKSKENKVNG